VFADRDTGKHFLMQILKPFIHKQLKLRVRSSTVNRYMGYKLVLIININDIINFKKF